MGNMVQATIKVRGTRPHLWCAFTPAALGDGTRKVKTGAAGNDPTEWKRTVLALPDKTLYIHPTYVFGALVNAARHTKDGRGTLQSKVAATLQVVDNVVPFNRSLPDDTPPTDMNAPVYLDIRGVKNPATKARNVRYRVAASPGWETEFTVLWDQTIVGVEQMQAVAIDAGRFVGLGDGRNIGFGRFEVTDFKAIEV
jgi:hypothetical protein